MKKNKKEYQIRIGKKRIKTLFDIAEKNAIRRNFTLADRNIEIARKIAMRYQISIPSELKKRYCKHCYSYIIPSITGRVRIHRNKVIIFCNKCEKFTRIPLKK